jgi:hypothetical protein
MTKNPLNKRGMLLGGVAAGLLTLGGAALLPAAAAERMGINLGTTSFFDGFGGADKGCTVITYIGHDTFNSLNGPNGSKEPLPAQLDANYIAPQIACSSDITVAGGRLGWNTIVPFSEQNSGSGAVVPGATNGTGLGDILVGPYIAFAPTIKDGHPVFAHSLELDIITPTGKYNSNIPVNPGNDYWSINPFWRATWLPAHGWEVSWRLNYIHNFDHLTTPNAAFPIPGGVLRNGDGAWANFTVSREIFKDFYFGVNGYWLKQLTSDTLVAGGKVPNSQQESLYIGPGFHYTIDKHNMVNFNVYLPVRDVNALSDGYQVNLQYTHPLN